jgi:hypothetical protein
VSEQNTQIVASDSYEAPFPVAPRGAGAMAPGEVPQGARGLMDGNSQTASMVAASMATVELQMKMAMSFPRDLDMVVHQIAQACKNPEFAKSAIYAYPRGKTTVTGPSIKMAEELSRHWGNINSGFYVVNDTPSQRTVRAWAWDMQTNVRKEMDVSFGKLIQRNVNGVTQWLEPDERDLLQLTNNNAKRGVRNVILALIPNQVQRDALSWCRQTLRASDAKDPDVMRKSLITSFASIGVKPDVVRDLAGKALDEITLPADEKTVEYLRGIYNRMKTGEASLADLVAERAQELGVEGPAPRTAAELRKRINQKASGG